MRAGIAVAVLAFTVFVNGCGREAPERFEALAAALSKSRPPADVRTVLPADQWQRVRAFYRELDDRRVWTEEGGLRSSFGEALALLEDAGRDGLTPEHYDLAWLREQDERRGGLLSRDALEDADALRIELRTTAAVLRWARDLAVGRFNPARPGRWILPKRAEGPEQVIASVIEEGRLRDAASRLRPPHGEYEALLKLRQEYRDVSAGTGWPEVPGTRRVREGQNDKSVPALRARLAAEGDLASRHANSRTVLDDAVAGALRTYQARHGLPETGDLDRATRAALGVPLSERIRQIDVNIERWRFAPREFGQRYVRVNIPDYHLALVEKGRAVLGMRVVTGARDTPTPVLTDEMRHIVFSPYWNIPESITNDEVVPALLNDPGYLERNDIEVVRIDGDRAEVLDASSVDWVFGADDDLRLRQRPGSRNALGQVKFVLANNLSIYLHDTPADGLFSRVSRALSHGCVRVERPITLARTLLDRGAWDEERIQKAMDQQREQWVRLEEPVPVHLTYFTAWVDPNGRAAFREDVYGHDAAHARALDLSGRRRSRAQPGS
jgi:murein L,D-transpeptidase YcbB/YkuD